MSENIGKVVQVIGSTLDAEFPEGKLPEIGFCHFHKEDCVRDPLIIQIMDLWFNEDEKDDEY